MKLPQFHRFVIDSDGGGFEDLVEINSNEVLSVSSTGCATGGLGLSALLLMIFLMMARSRWRGSKGCI